ncbi:MAG TPA: phosphonate ABC transporter, permease protein PhnE [Lactovum miscens]|uniref:Phosphonate transport system permease protein n=1 Tax=Lactovum miscens TaxID=190387 RepID=A0A841C5L7_9LACT|nr:phosphonate ABC transporter, permease protein PhnE [Lactovum miscens]MBB5887567.1 phosphonate transport system permease protein [Lactovum miscens]
MNTNMSINKKILDYYENRPRRWQYITIILILVLGISWWSSSSLNSLTMTKQGSAIALEMLKGIVNPDTKILFALGTSGVLYLLLQTIAIAILGTIVGAIIAVPLSFLSATNMMPKPIAYVVRLLIMAIRTVPSFVYALFFVGIVGMSPSAGVMALGLESVGMIAKLFIESIEDLDTGIIESMDAAGASWFQKIRFGVLPQLLPELLSNLLYRLDMNLRDASILGLVGAGGIGAPLIFAMNGQMWSKAGSILIALFILIVIVELISSQIRKVLMKG